MTTEQQLIEALNETIKTQKELISLLKAENEQLKLSKLFLNPFTVPNTGPSTPGVPNSTPPYPLMPGQLPYVPSPNPLLTPPYVVTCNTGPNSELDRIAEENRAKLSQ